MQRNQQDRPVRCGAGMTCGLSIMGVVFAGAIMFALIGAPATLQGCAIGLIASGVLIGRGMAK